jgi:hypothetical protein
LHIRLSVWLDRPSGVAIEQYPRRYAAANASGKPAPAAASREAVPIREARMNDHYFGLLRVFLRAYLDPFWFWGWNAEGELCDEKKELLSMLN